MKQIPNSERFLATETGDIFDSVRNIFLKKRLTQNGYYMVRAGKHNALVHRMVSMAFIPNPLNNGQVNHINGIKTDNSISNLEWCNNRYNVSDHYARSKTTSRYTGVSFHKRSKKWQAQIRVDGKNIALGYFVTEELARDAYNNKLSTL